MAELGGGEVGMTLSPWRRGSVQVQRSWEEGGAELGRMVPQAGGDFEVTWFSPCHEDSGSGSALHAKKSLRL